MGDEQVGQAGGGAMTEWQDIATAPRDGTWFVACRAGEPDSYEIGCYSLLKYPRYIEIEGGLYRKEDETIYEWRGFNNMRRMTHWLSIDPVPLPAPPKEG